MVPNRVKHHILINNISSTELKLFFSGFNFGEKSQRKDKALINSQ